MKQLNISSRRQSGVTLIVSLVILVALTVLGVTSMQSTRTEISMAGNQRETGLMFQAAEVGLVTAEDFIETSTTNADFDDSTLGLHTVVPNDTTYFGPDYFDYATWTASSPP